MADSATEIDLDSVIDRLLEGELSPASRALRSCSPSPDPSLRPRSARQPPRKACTTTGVRNQVSLHESPRNFHQPTHPPRARGSHKDLWCVPFSRRIFVSLAQIQDSAPLQVISMASTTICSDSSSTAVSHQKPTTCSLVTTSTVASSRSKRYVSSSPTKSSTRRTSSY